jgi:hypothetical protein
MSPKTWLAALTAVASLLVGFLSDNSMSLHEWILFGGSFAIAIQMYVVPNLDASVAKYAKGVTAFVTAALAVLIVVLPGGVTTSEWIQVGIAALAAIGVPLLPAPQFPAVPSVPNEPNPQV